MTTQSETDIWTQWMVGRPLGTRTVEITPELVQSFEGAVDKHNPRYQTPAANGRVLAPTAAINWDIVRMTPNPPAYGVPRSSRNAGQEWEFFRPVYLGDILTLTAKTGEKRVTSRGHRVFYSTDVSVVNQNREPVCNVTFHRTFLLTED